MAKFCDDGSIIVVVAVLTGVCIGALPMWEVVKEFGLLLAAALALMKFKGLTTTDVKNAFIRRGEPRSVITSRLPPRASASRHSGDTWNRITAPRTVEKSVAAPSVHQESRQLSKRPVLPPTFTSQIFDEQVDELCQQLLPTEKCQKVVQAIADDIKNAILKTLPYAEVVGFTNGEVSRGTAYGVAVPEVDIVVNLPPHILVRTLQSQNAKTNFSGKVDDRRLHKTAIRMCTDLLVSSGGFKFRRSAFRGRDPKVTLMAPRALDESGCIPVDFSVNAAIPLCNSVLIAACAHVDPRAKLLVLLVKRWAKDRGICHAAKGHLMPYAWTLLVVYFLQVGVEGGSILPPFKHLRLAPGQDTKEIAGLAQCMQHWMGPAAGSTLAKKSVGQLFKEFINFYLTEVDWRKEVACIRTGQRALPHRAFKLHVIETATGPATGPTIEDPFMPNENMSEMLTAHGLSRFWEELARAQVCFDSNAALSEILTQYVPPERRAEQEEGSGDEEDTTVPCVHPTPSPLAALPRTTTMAKVSGTPLMPPGKKSPSPLGSGALAAQTKNAPAVPKQLMTPPPGLWAAKGRPPMAWPTPACDATAVA